MKATGLAATEDSVALFTTSVAAKRAYFSAEPQRCVSLSNWREQQLVRDLLTRRCAQPEIVGVLCGRKLHRLRLVAAGGSVVLLNHPQLHRKAELAVVALGAPLPDCLLVLDAIAGRVSDRRILWRRRPYRIAAAASIRRSCRRRGPAPALELPLAERYATFVRHRASLWLSRLLPAGAEFDVRVVPPQALAASVSSSTVWSWRQRPGITPQPRHLAFTVHVPFDWHVSVEQAHTTALHTAFVIEARGDRRGEMLLSLHGEAKRIYYADRLNWTTRLAAVADSTPVPAKRWQRARGSCRVTLPDRLSGGRANDHSATTQASV